MFARRNASLSVGANGTGVSSDPTLCTGPSRYSNASDAITAAISPPNPPVSDASWTIRTFPVSRTLSTTRSRSRGWIDRRSTTRTSFPVSCANWSAGLDRRLNRRAVRQHHCCITLAANSPFPDRNKLFPFRHILFDAPVEIFVFEKEDRIVVPYRRLHQTSCIGRRGRARQFSTRRRS